MDVDIENSEIQYECISIMDWMEKMITVTPSKVMPKDNFNLEWKKAVMKFKVLVGLESLKLNLLHPKTRTPAKPHLAIPDTFIEWQKIQSLWERRSLIFEVIFSLVKESLKTWQIANYLTVQRRPLEAFDLLLNDIKQLETQTQDKIQEDYVQYCSAIAKTLISLTQFENALKLALKAYIAAPNEPRIELLLADAYFLTKNYQQANAIYQKHWLIIKRSEKQPIKKMFSEVFSSEQGTSSSPILAIQMGKLITDASQTEEFWQLAEAEFYSSPYFRSHHAYLNANQGKIQQSFAKSLALVQEMPQKGIQVISKKHKSNISLQEIQDKIQKAKEQNLTKLDLRLDKITSLPDSITQLVNLTHLDLSRNQITSLPDSIGQLVSLTHLDLSRNQITSLPDSITQLINLTHLDLSRNQITSLPDSIGQLVSLTHLDLSRNQITNIPDSITQLINLTHLDLSRNQITSLPDSIGQLVSLTHLDLSRNQITNIPDSITQLIILHLEGNQITNIPDSITQLVKLIILNLSGNPLEEPPLEICNQGIQAIRKYFQ